MRRLFAAFSWALAIASLLPFGALADPITVTSEQIDSFRGAGFGQLVDKLVYRGGLAMSSESDMFGGLSGIAFTGPDQKLAMVSDVGRFVSGQLIYDQGGAPLDLVGVSATAIQNSKGHDLPRAFARDAEAIDTISRDGVPGAVRVGFENLTRVADFELTDNKPGGPAREVKIPDWLTKLRTNESLEAVCIAPPASPIAGSTLLITEAARAADGNYAAYMLGHDDKGPFTVTSASGLNPTDCAFLPNGDLLILERGTALLSFVMQIRRIKAENVQPGRDLKGEVLLTASGGDVDNMEGIAVHPGPDGDTRITIISDDNFNDWERNLLLEFSLPAKDVR